MAGKLFFVSPSAGYDHFIWQNKPDENILVTLNLSVVLEYLQRPLVYFMSVDYRFNIELIHDISNSQGRIIYDYLDAFDDKVSNATLTVDRFRLHENLLADEDSVFVIATASEILNDVKTKRSKNYALVTNGVDTAHFQVERSLNRLRADFAAIVERGSPIVGYYGALASWLDYDLLNKLAIENAEIELVLIGPNFDRSITKINHSLPNIHVLDPIPYNELPRHAVWFDVALIPFVNNYITNATSPLKLYEYMALRRPIVSTNIPEVCTQELVNVGKLSQRVL